MDLGSRSSAGFESCAAVRYTTATASFVAKSYQTQWQLLRVHIVQPKSDFIRGCMWYYDVLKWRSFCSLCHAFANTSEQLIVNRCRPQDSTSTPTLANAGFRCLTLGISTSYPPFVGFSCPSAAGTVYNSYNLSSVAFNKSDLITSDISTTCQPLITVDLSAMDLCSQTFIGGTNFSELSFSNHCSKSPYGSSI